MSVPNHVFNHLLTLPDFYYIIYAPQRPLVFVYCVARLKKLSASQWFAVSLPRFNLSDHQTDFIIRQRQTFSNDNFVY